MNFFIEEDLDNVMKARYPLDAVRQQDYPLSDLDDTPPPDRDEGVVLTRRHFYAAP